MSCKHETYSLSYQTKKDGIKMYHATKYKFCPKCQSVLEEVPI